MPTVLPQEKVTVVSAVSYIEPVALQPDHSGPGLSQQEGPIPSPWRGRGKYQLFLQESKASKHSVKSRSEEAGDPATSAAPAGTPDNQRMAYGLPLDQTATNSRNLQLVWGPGTFGVLDSDLTEFWDEYDVDASLADVEHEVR